MAKRTFRRFSSCLLLIAWALVIAPSARAQPASSQYFASGESAFERGDYATALGLFEQALAAGSTGPAVHYNIAVCQYRLGDYAAAERSFRALGADYPALRELADYNLGLTLVASEREAEAADAFRRAAGSDDAVVAELAQAMLARLGRAEAAGAAEARPAWTRLVDMNVGNDDNVALIEASSLPLGRSTESAYADAFVYFGGPLARSGRWSLDASAFLVSYADAGEYDQRSLSVGAAHGWRLPAWRLELGPRYSYTTLDGDGLEQRLGVDVRMAHALGERGQLQFRLAYDDVGAIATRFAYLEGSRDEIAIEWRHRLGRAEVSAAFLRESNDRLDPGVSPTRDRWTLRYASPVGADWRVAASASRRDSRYEGLATPRDESLDELRVVATRDLGGAWQLNAEAQVGSNDSNDAAFVYDRHRIAIGLSKLF